MPELHDLMGKLEGDASACFEVLARGVMQSGDSGPFVPNNFRIEIAWSRYVNLKRALDSPRLP